MAVVADTLRNYRVGDVKSAPVVVTGETSVYDAAVNMFLEDVGTLFVVKEGTILEGVVSRKDLLRVTLGRTNVRRMPVNVMMTRMPNIVTTTAEESVLVAARKMVDHEVDALPVVRHESNGSSADLEVVGRLSKTRITRLFADIGEEA